VPSYRGRFAPSPTGLLHFGSLVAAVASYLDARHAEGDWLVRMEDLDRPREVAGSADAIVRALDVLGFEWTESIVRQSERSDLYQAAMDRLLASNLTYPCSCSRAEIQQQAGSEQSDGDELRYPRWCRRGPRAPERPLAIRLCVPDAEISFNDRIQGRIAINVSAEVGDFVIRRRDGLFAYQLAVVVDDAVQGITHVVRGADLLHSTPRQILLQQFLGLATPVYAHVPVATDSKGVKLSKSAGAAAVDLTQPGKELWRALQFLGQRPPQDLRKAGPETLWRWAVENWQPEALRFGLSAVAVLSA
jgi:glutamyl-Q tRNA(Asp) synthetase